MGAFTGMTDGACVRNDEEGLMGMTKRAARITKQGLPTVMRACPGLTLDTAWVTAQ